MYNSNSEFELAIYAASFFRNYLHYTHRVSILCVPGDVYYIQQLASELPVTRCYPGTYISPNIGRGGGIWKILRGYPFTSLTST